MKTMDQESCLLHRIKHVVVLRSFILVEHLSGVLVIAFAGKLSSPIINVTS
jgi:hypothetical protein